VDTIKFQVALRELSQGRIPPNIDEVVGYAEATVYEMRQAVSALAECVKRQDKTLQLVRAMRDGLQRQARKGGAPQWVGPSAELIPGDKEG
jgi:hypothetical protein